MVPDILLIVLLIYLAVPTIIWVAAFILISLFVFTTWLFTRRNPTKID